ncbi:MAG: SDR family oxidoreductase [Acetobacteraceae bacterium]
MSENIAVIAGATGAAASRLTELIARTPGWLAVGLCRNPPTHPPSGNVRYVRTDLSSAESCRVAIADAGAVTHVVYASRAPFGEGGVEDVPANVAMLRNLLDAVEIPSLRHIHLLEGGKWYGLHLGPMLTPTREDDPRHLPPNFYYDQQDLLTARRVGKGWTWSASRPQYLVDVEPGRPRNLVTVVGAYAAICRELGAAFDFPGKPGAYTALSEFTDCTMLARFIFWAMNEPRAADQAFNITNGDTFRWSRLWPRLAEYFGLRQGIVRTLNLEQWMADKGPVWQAIAERHRLRYRDIAHVALWPYGSFVWNIDWDVVSSMNRARMAGFHHVDDTEDQFIRHLDAYREWKVLP